jgi:peptidyl-prolyl cis-trans isomerase D
MWALAILIIPAFVIWGAGTSGKDKDGKPDYAGKLFGKKISYDDYYDMWNVARDYAVKSFGNNVPEEFIDQLAWTRIILIETARREKITVTDREVVERIASIPAFQRDGAFDRKLYKSMLQDTARAFEEKLRDDLLISGLRERITSLVNVSDEEVKNEYKKKFEKIKSSYALIPFTDFEKDVQYTDTGLVDFYEKNKTSFRKGEQANVRYIEIPVSAEGAEDLAYKVLDQVKLKKGLEEPAKSNSLEIKETGFFSVDQEVPAIGWSYDFMEISFGLEKDQINEALIKTDKGFYIIQLKEKKGPYIPGYEEVKDAVKNAFIKNAAIGLAKEKAEKVYLDADARVKNNEKFVDILKEYALEAKETDYIGRDGYVPEIGPAREFVDMALSLETGAVSKPLKSPAGWVIIQPLELITIDESKFIEEKEKFKEGILSDKKEKEFDKYFQDLQKKAGFVSYTSK